MKRMLLKASAEPPEFAERFGMKTILDLPAPVVYTIQASGARMTMGNGRIPYENGEYPRSHRALKAKATKQIDEFYGEHIFAASSAA